MNRTGAILGMFLGIATAVTAAVPATPSFAEDREIVVAQNDGGGFFRRLFGNRRQSPSSPPSIRPDQLFPGFERLVPRRERRARSPSAPAAPQVTAVEKAADAKRAMVVGDFMAGALAKGLAEAYAENPNVVVIDASNGSSGLVRKDFYDWPAQLPALAAEQKPDAILVMVGGNDRQGIDTEAGSYALGTDGWRAAYAARVAAFADALKATGKPVFWGGLVPVAPSAMSRDYSSFNGIMREQLEAKGLRFVDMWNGFADDEGKYVAVGPDVRGQSVQLRASDGLNFTRAGQRKLAYFVEQELSDVFGGATLQVAAADAAAAVGPPAPDAPKIGPMVPLDALSLAGGDALSSGSDGSGSVAETISERLAKEDSEAAPPARVDSYIWPPRTATGAPVQ